MIFPKVFIIDGFVKSPFCPIFVIPAKAGIQLIQAVLDSCFRRSDGFSDFLRDHHNLSREKVYFNKTHAYNLTSTEQLVIVKFIRTQISADKYIKTVSRKASGALRSLLPLR